jgi:phosphatidylserine decarboxylase
LSPADGKVMLAETLPDGRRHVAIFLSVFNVHVNRAPVSGSILKVTRTPGTYFHAGTPQASGNARIEVEAESAYGPVQWQQMSGLVARKISCYLKPGDRVRAGDKYGLIYFGSRMDVYLPPAARLVTEPGRRVAAGETVIAEFSTEELR